jgi:hypothetical protein
MSPGVDYYLNAGQDELFDFISKECLLFLCLVSHESSSTRTCASSVWFRVASRWSSTNRFGMRRVTPRLDSALSMP